MKTFTQKIVSAALFAAIVFVLTRIVSIPSFTSVGNINLGDCAVLMAAWMLPMKYSFLAAGIGSALADLVSPYAVYTPATFLIKGAMALAAGLIFGKLLKKIPFVPRVLISGICAEMIMIAGYLAFETILYGFGTALLNVPYNAIQGTAGLVSATVLVGVLKKAKKSRGDS